MLFIGRQQAKRLFPNRHCMTRVYHSTYTSNDTRRRQTVRPSLARHPDPCRVGVSTDRAQGKCRFQAVFCRRADGEDRVQTHDINKQSEVEDNIAPWHSSQVLPVNHPAYEYLLFAPLTNLTYRTAYLAWMGINLCLLALCYRLLLSRCDAWLLSALFLGFAPVVTVLIHGQDSLLLLLLFILAVDRGDFRSGLLIGLGAFKVHIILPVLILYMLWRRWRFAAGFLVSAGCAAIVSVVLVGSKAA